jgi:hypothetical protein
VKSWLASSGQLRNLFSGILEEMCHNQFRAICAEIKEVKTTNMKGSDKQKDEPLFSCISAPSDIHLFGPLRYALHRHHFADDNNKNTVRTKSSDASTKQSAYSL